MKREAFTLIETLIAVAIFVILIGGIFTVLSMGRSSWYQADLSIELQQNLRRGMDRIVRELHESGCENVDHVPVDICEASEYRVEISDDTGINNTDILKFSMYLDCNGTKRWAAPLYWACKDASCLDQDSECGTIEYYKVEYLMNSENQLTRRVLDTGESLVREDVIAGNIQDFQVSRNGDIVDVQISVEGTDVFGRYLTYNLNNQAYLRNLFKE